MANCGFILLAVASLLAGCHGQTYGSPSCSSGPPVPANIRVWAIPDAYYQVGPPASGFLVQLLNALQGVTGIPYTLTPHPELSFGNQNANGSFDGSLVGALINNQADLVGTDLTVTAAREAVVDFLEPFSQYQLEVLVNVKVGCCLLQYLCLDNADLQYLKNAKNATLNQIYANIEAGAPSSLVTTNAAALAKVAGNAAFAYVGESNEINIALAANPASAQNVVIQPGALGTFYLALAVQQGSALRTKLNLAMLQLAESGALQPLLNAANLS